MKMVHESGRTLVDYLLGAMPELQRVELEHRLFRDEALDEELLATTDDLIQDYLRGDLSHEDRQRFETHFLASPEHRDRLEWMKDLADAVERMPAPSRPARRAVGRLLLAAAAVVAVARLLLPPSPEPERPQAALTPRPAVPETPRAGPAPRPGATRTPSTPSRVRTVRLAGNVASPVDVALPPDTRTLRIEIAVSDESPSYDAMIRTADGREVWRAEGLAPQTAGAPLILSVPSRVLIADAYALRVEGEPLREGQAPVLEYRLRIVHDR